MPRLGHTVRQVAVDVASRVPVISVLIVTVVFAGRVVGRREGGRRRRVFAVFQPFLFLLSRVAIRREYAFFQMETARRRRRWGYVQRGLMRGQGGDQLVGRAGRGRAADFVDVVGADALACIAGVTSDRIRTRLRRQRHVRQHAHRAARSQRL